MIKYNNSFLNNIYFYCSHIIIEKMAYFFILPYYIHYINIFFLNPLIIFKKMSEEDKIKETLISNKIENKTDTGNNNVELSKKKIWYVFGILVVVSLLSNFDNGIIPCASSKMEKDLNTTSAEFGFLGSADYLGRIISSMVYLQVINKINRKIILSITLFVKAISLFLCVPIEIYYFVVFMRILNGSSQIFFTIYLPIWCDQFGDKNKRTMMIALIQLGLPFGIVFGYGICLIFGKNWKISFIIEGILCILLAIFIFSIDNLLFDKNLVKINKNEKDNDTNNTTLISQDSIIETEYNNRNNIMNDNTNNTQTDSNEYVLFSNEEIKEEKSTLLLNLTNILTNSIFIIMTLGISLTYFTMGGLKFWTPNYLDYKFKGKNFDIPYLIISFTGPTLGIVLGGISGTCVGGYSSKHAILVCFFFVVSSTIFGIISCFTSNFYMWLLFIWLYFFFGTGIVPLGTGIVINSVSNDIKGDAVTINNFLQNSIGNLPPSYVYGLIKEYYGHNIAMKVLFYCGIVNSVNLIIGCFIRYFKIQDNNDDDGNTKS